MTSLIDTKVLVYRFDPRFPDKQRVASQLLEHGLVAHDVALPPTRRSSSSSPR